MQALCFLAGANSIFYGEKLLTTGNPDVERDQRLFARLGIRAERSPAAGQGAGAALPPQCPKRAAQEPAAAAPSSR
jgi:biotin synthase